MNKLNDNEITALEKQFGKDIIHFVNEISTTKYNKHKVYSLEYKNNLGEITANFYFHKNFKKKVVLRQECANWKYSNNYIYYYDIIILSNNPIMLIKYFLKNKYLLSKKSILLYCPIVINNENLNEILNYHFNKIYTIFEKDYRKPLTKKIKTILNNKINIQSKTL